jgi:hypothetical protein
LTKESQRLRPHGAHKKTVAWDLMRLKYDLIGAACVESSRPFC